MAFGSGWARGSFAAEIWDIETQAGALLARFDHSGSNIVNDTPVHYSLPLTAGGMALHVWPQATTQMFVTMAVPPNGITHLARSRLVAAINAKILSWQALDAEAQQTENKLLEAQLRALRRHARAAGIDRLNARHLKQAPFPSSDRSA